jgi:hypothetical protein
VAGIAGVIGWRTMSVIFSGDLVSRPRYHSDETRRGCLTNLGLECDEAESVEKKGRGRLYDI